MAFVALALVLQIASIYAQTCNPLNGVSTFNADCTDNKYPYCVLTSEATVIPPVYECKACISDCDCEYMSTQNIANLSLLALENFVPVFHHPLENAKNFLEVEKVAEA